MTTTFRCAPHISWLRDAGRVVLLDSTPERPRSQTLCGLDAVVWDLLVQRTRWDELCRTVALVERSTPAEVAPRVRAALDALVSTGVLHRRRVEG